MKTHKLRVVLLCFAIASSFINAQQNVTYNGKTLKPAEVIEAQIGSFGKTISLKISEIEMSTEGTWAKKVKAAGFIN